jgi:agmatine deiminase
MANDRNDDSSSRNPLAALHPTRREFMQMAGLGAIGCLAGGPVGQALAAGAFVVPDESVPQTRLWMAWPSSYTIWGSSLLYGIQTDIATICRTIAKYEPVYMMCDGSTNAATAKSRVGSTVFPVKYISTIPVNDCWARDTGAVYRNNGAGGQDCIGLRFNGWGGKQTYSKDQYVAERMAAYLGTPFTKTTILHGEGGGVIQDGDGTLIATESCWVNSNRNPGLSKAQIEAELLRLFGAQKMIWCKGIVGQDITDDHIDATAMFVSPGKLVVHNPPAGATDIWSQDARDIYNVLSNATDAKGRRFQITLIDQPVYTRVKSKDMLKSYINYLAVNNAIINVNFGDTSKDAAAKAKLEALYPGRTVEMLKLDTLYGYGGGGVHCVTQQQPVA